MDHGTDPERWWRESDVSDLLLLVAVIAAGMGIWAAITKSRRLAITAGVLGGGALLVVGGILLAIRL